MTHAVVRRSDGLHPSGLLNSKQTKASAPKMLVLSFDSDNAYVDEDRKHAIVGDLYLRSNLHFIDRTVSELSAILVPELYHT